MECQLLMSPWKRRFTDIIGQAERELFISSPYVNVGGVSALAASIRTKSSIRLTLITNFSPQNILNGVTEPQALLGLHDHFADVSMSSLGRLHAKVYLVDQKAAVITSANLTVGGIVGNFEYGVLINDTAVIAAIRSDMLRYFSLGNILNKPLLEKVYNTARELIETRTRANQAVKATPLAALLSEKTERLETELLKNRVRGGKTVNGIFCDTIIYVLQKEGPLSTAQLHSFIQTVHPDICDDSIDRVINGQNFGKKWKHLVRDAQQHLKKKGLIKLSGDKWHLTTGADR